MRDIRFRAWDKTSKMMMQSEYLVDLINGYAKLAKEEGIEPTIDDWEWLQYTGLKDKNGKEEYQFDITRNKYGQIRHIDWYCGAWWLMFPDGRNDKPLYGSHSAQEVIGNIYENGDLIK